MAQPNPTATQTYDPKKTEALLGGVPLGYSGPLEWYSPTGSTNPNDWKLISESGVPVGKKSSGLDAGAGNVNNANSLTDATKSAGSTSQAPIFQGPQEPNYINYDEALERAKASMNPLFDAQRLDQEQLYAKQREVLPQAWAARGGLTRLKSYGGIGAAQQEATQAEMAARDKLEGQRQSAISQEAFNIENNVNSELRQQYELAFQKAKAEHDSKADSWWKEVMMAVEKENSNRNYELEEKKLAQNSEQFYANIGLTREQMAQDQANINREFEEGKRRYDYDTSLGIIMASAELTGQIMSKEDAVARDVYGILPDSAYGQTTFQKQQVDEGFNLDWAKLAQDAKNRAASGSGRSSSGTAAERANAATSFFLGLAQEKLDAGMSGDMTAQEMLKYMPQATQTNANMQTVFDYIKNYSPITEKKEAQRIKDGVATYNDIMELVSQMFNPPQPNKAVWDAWNIR
jgi:hypothetical protein